MVIETFVLKVSDSSCDERMIWDYSLVIYPCLTLHLAGGASCRNINNCLAELEIQTKLLYMKDEWTAYFSLLYILNTLLMSLFTLMTSAVIQYHFKSYVLYMNNELASISSLYIF